MRNAVQLNAKVKHLATEKGLTHEVVLRNYMLERFLERISQSKYRSHVILKGGMLISSMVGIETRTTMDLDASLKGLTLSESEIIPIIKDIIMIPLKDNVVFSYEGIQTIKESGDYPGFRVNLTASLERTRQRLKIDIATGDTITPKEIKYDYPMMFEKRSIPIMAYNLETVLAEKYETVISRSVLNTRMRDFYDIHILQKMMEINVDHFKKAFEETTIKRETRKEDYNRKIILNTILISEDMKQSWAQYQRKYEYAESVSWKSIVNALTGLEKMLVP